MAILHLSISAAEPERAARVLARVLGGRALPFPPFPHCWIAFAAADDGTAIEVYPQTHTLRPGPHQIDCGGGAPDTAPTCAHAAVASPLDRTEILDIAGAEGWTGRICNRGPFACVEIWIEDRVLIEVLDPAMQADYRAGMTMAGWSRMFGLD